MAYVKTVWATGDVITAAKFNNAENGIEATAIVADAALPKAGGTMTGSLTVSQDAARIFVNRPLGGVNSTAGLMARDNDVNQSGMLWDYDTSQWEIFISPNYHKVWHSGNDGAGSGLGADTVDGLHFRVTAGIVEYSTDGATWKAVGSIMIGASNTLQESFDTQRTTTASGNHMLVARHNPKGTGDLKIMFDLYKIDAAANAIMNMFFSSDDRNSSATSGQGAPFSRKLYIYSDTPIGTELSPTIPSAQYESLGENSVQSTWLTITVYIQVTELVPIQLTLSSSATASCRNVRFYYDIL